MQLTPEVLKQKQLERQGRTDLITRYVEPAMTVGSSLASEIAAGLGGLATMNPDNVGDIHHAGTYIPRTESGREGLAGLGEFLSSAGELAMDTPYLGAAVRNFGESREDLIDAGYPGLAAALQTAPAFVATVTAPQSRGAFSNVAGDIGREIASGGNMGRGGLMANQRGMVNPRVIAEAVTSKKPSALDFTSEVPQLFPDSRRIGAIDKNGGMYKAIVKENPSITNAKNGKVTAYRATVGDKIRKNDFVALNPKVAKDMLKSLKERGENGKIVKAEVDLNDLIMGNDATEFTWSPTTGAKPSFGQSGYAKPSVFAAPVMQTAKAFKFSKAPVLTATERTAERVGKGLEGTHKTYVAEKTAAQQEKEHSGRNLLKH